MKALNILKNLIKEDITFKKICEINEAIKELEDLQNRKCENCKHFSTGKQPDGFKWQECEYSFECKTCFNDYYERTSK